MYKISMPSLYSLCKSAALCFAVVSFSICLQSAAVAEIDADNKAFELGCNLMIQKQFMNAIGSFTLAISKNPNDPNCYFRRGQCFYCLQNFDQAILDFERAISCDKDNPNFFLWRGTAYARQDKDDLAVRDYEKAMRLDPQLIEAYKKGQSEKKEASVELVQPDPTKKTQTINVGSSERALKDYVEAVSRASSNVTGYFRPGTVYSGIMGMDGKALAIPGYADDPNEVLLEKRHGGNFFSLKNPGKEMREFDQKINDSPNVAAFYFARARAYEQLGHTDEALSDLSRAVDLDRVNASYLLARAFLYHQLTKQDLADLDIRRAQDIDPSVPAEVKFEPPVAQSSTK